MIPAINTALSGLLASETRLNVTGNNIANVHTPGFKASRVVQSDVSGGGTQVAAISRNHLDGAIYQTGIPSDRAIEGDGFFVLENADGSESLTRNGAFSTDLNGDTVDASGRALREGELQSFRNPGGLISKGESTFQQGPASGDAFEGEGKVVRGALEASNVDLSKEVVNQILAQRSFQANLSVIRASDQMTQTLLDIKS